ncbi:MAG: hypothetical protein KC483_10300 [Nitrosarchaeum sp.]|nr:hypothetical protein [Nitrosarchaeum sp.]
MMIPDAMRSDTILPEIKPDVEINIKTSEITMHKGEAKIIPITIRNNTEEPTHAKLWVYSTNSEDIAAESPISNESLGRSFEEIKKRGLDDGFSIFLDEQEFQLAINQNTKIVSVRLTASDSVKKGEHYFAHPLYTKSFSLEQITYAKFHVTVE